jgi:hypothetical protein
MLSFQAILILKEYMSPNTKIPNLTELICQTEACHAKDPLDRVYALLSLSNDDGIENSMLTIQNRQKTVRNVLLGF